MSNGADLRIYEYGTTKFVCGPDVRSLSGSKRATTLPLTRYNMVNAELKLFQKWSQCGNQLTYVFLVDEALLIFVESYDRTLASTLRAELFE